MAVKDWFHDFLADHMKRFPRADWPRPAENPQFYSAIKSVFVRHGVTEAVALGASERLAEDPPAHLNDHLPALLKHAREIFKEQAAAGTGQPTDSREAAHLASKGCDDCGGDGLAHRYRHQGERPGQTVVCYCLCPYGRWVEETHRRHSPDVRKRIVDLRDYPWLQIGPVSWKDEHDNKFRYPPEIWDSYHERPLPPAESLRVMAGNIGRKVEDVPVPDARREPVAAY
jgi:hypothetical protein